MSWIRTQVYLTPEQRRRLDELARGRRTALARLIREAVDRYLQESGPGAAAALQTTFGRAPGRHRLHYSVVTRCELFAGRGTDEEAVRLLLTPFPELPVDRAVAERAGRLRRETGVHTPDALIAATALEHRLTLVTRNVRDFERVHGLRTSAPERILPAG